MIRRSTMIWASIILLVLFAFAVMPAHEYFKDAQGLETDVSPNAPPMPEWLKSVDTKDEERINE